MKLSDIEKLDARDKQLMKSIRDNMSFLEPYLADENVTEIVLFEKGVLATTERGSMGSVKKMQLTPEQLLKINETLTQYFNFLKIKSHYSFDTNYFYNNERFHAINKYGQPTFNIRKRNSFVMPLSMYVERGGISQEVADILKQKVLDRKNILIIGATDTGKTTFINSLLNVLQENKTNLSVGILEDTPELVYEGDFLKYHLVQPWEDITHEECVKAMLRESVKYNIVGEVRGSEAAELLNSFQTGSSGIASIHGDNILSGLRRLKDLASKNHSNVNFDLKTITEIIDTAILLVKKPINGVATYAVGEILTDMYVDDTQLSGNKLC